MADDFRPNRCQAGTKLGQCNQDCQPGSKFCYRHDYRAEGNARHMYQLNLAKDRDAFKRMSDSEELLSLKNELVLQRMLIEEHLNDNHTPIDRMAAFNRVTAAMLAVEKLVKSAESLEKKSGAVLSKSSLYRLIADVVDIVAEEIQGVEGYDEIIDNIQTRIATAIAGAKDED